MSSLFQNKQVPTMVHVGTIDLNQLNSFIKSQRDEKVERCDEAAFMNSDRQQTIKLMSSALSDTVKAKKKQPKHSK